MNIKDIINYLKDPDKKLYLYTAILVVVLVVILFIVLLISLFGSKNMSYEQVEKVMIKSAEEYANDKKILLTRDSFKKNITVDKLIEEEYMKELKKYNRKYETCSGKVTVTYNGDNFLFTPYLNCGKEYRTKYLADILKKSNLDQDKAGLYKINDEYIYRGENPNNYIKFAGQLWRIVKINDDGSIKIIQSDIIAKRQVFDDRYNASCPKNKYLCSGFSNFETSRLKEYTSDAFENELKFLTKSLSFTKDEKKLMLYKNICIGSVSENLKIEDGYPECSLKTENKYPYDFIKLNEYIMPSLDSGCKSIKDMQCTNYNYMTNISNYWTATTIDSNNYQVYYISSLPELDYVYKNKSFVYVLNLSSNVLYKGGDGTEEKPYLIKTFSK